MNGEELDPNSVQHDENESELSFILLCKINLIKFTCRKSIANRERNIFMGR